MGLFRVVLAIIFHHTLAVIGGVGSFFIVYLAYFFVDGVPVYRDWLYLQSKLKGFRGLFMTEFCSLQLNKQYSP